METVEHKKLRKGKLQTIFPLHKLYTVLYDPCKISQKTKIQLVNFAGLIYNTWITFHRIFCSIMKRRPEKSLARFGFERQSVLPGIFKGMSNE